MEPRPIHSSPPPYTSFSEVRPPLVLCLPEDDVPGVERLLAELLLDLGASFARR